MTQKDRFKEWQSKYIDARGLMPTAWEAWQAAEYYALERSAEACESIAKGYPEPYSKTCDAVMCANNIRAMKNA